MIERANKVLPLTIGALCVGGAGFALATAWDAAQFISAVQDSKLASPHPTSTLLIILPALTALALSLAVTAWQLVRDSSKQRELAARCSVWDVLLWTTLCLYALLVNYPVPPQAHHRDKFLLICLALLGVVLWFALHPRSLERSLSTKSYGWAKFVVINMLVFVLAGEVAMRLADPILAM